MPQRDTIYALASAPGRAGIAVVRVSGARAFAALEAITGRPVPDHRRAEIRSYYAAGEKRPIDRGLALAFHGPESFTGEDVVECHIHGGPAVVAALLSVLGSVDGLRLAEPGEFTRRAFENGKLDLTEAEAIADLVNAETEAQRAQAMRQLEGDLGALYAGWRHSLLNAVAHLEAWLDFPEEELEGAEAETADVVASRIAPEVHALATEISSHLAEGHKGEIIRTGFRVAILGAPNVGKSTLLNKLASRDIAITSESAGTTRDVIEVRLDLGGYPIVITDTAGLRATEDAVEAEGVRRAEKAAEEANLKLVLVSGEAWPNLETAVIGHLDGEFLLVVNKSDIYPQNAVSLGQTRFGRALAVSAKTGEGLNELTHAISERASNALIQAADPFLTRHRHRQALEEVAGALTRFELGCKIDKYDSHRDSSSQKEPKSGRTQPSYELLAEDLRLAIRALGRITGRADVEDVLDIIFADFCIGK